MGCCSRIDDRMTSGLATRLFRHICSAALRRPQNAGPAIAADRKSRKAAERVDARHRLTKFDIE